MSTVKIAVIGLGEAGSLIAGGLLASGADVVGFDPVKPQKPVVPFLETAVLAAQGADVVMSLNSSSVALKVAEQLSGHLKPGAIFADLNTGTPQLKLAIEKILPSGAFVDVAVMKPVPGTAEKTPMGVAGKQAKKFIDIMAQFGMVLEYVSENPGEAAARKLIRSIVAKGMAALIIDCLWAAESIGMQDWAVREIKNEFNSSNESTVQRYLDGTAIHAKRRSVEMKDLETMLRDADYESTMVQGISATLAKVVNGKKIPFTAADN